MWTRARTDRITDDHGHDRGRGHADDASSSIASARRDSISGSYGAGHDESLAPTADSKQSRGYPMRDSRCDKGHTHDSSDVRRNSWELPRQKQ